MGDSFLSVHKPSSNWTEVRLLPCSAQHSCIHWGHLPEGSGKKIKPSLWLCFFKQAPGFPLLPFQHSYNYLQHFLRPVICADASFYVDVFETERCPTGSHPSWSCFPAGRARWPVEVGDVPLPLHCWHFWLSRQSSLDSSLSLGAWIRASQLAGRQVRGISPAQAAAITCAAAVHARGLCSETEEEISVTILAFKQLEKELTEAPGLCFHDCINLLLALERNFRWT